MKVGGLYSPVVPFVGYFDDWCAKLIADTWGWLSVVNRQCAGVLTAVQDPGGTVTVTVDNDLFVGPFPVNGSVHLGREGAYQLNGEQLIRANSARSFTTRNRVSIFTYDAGGSVLVTEKAFKAIGALSISRVVERKVGRPSYLSRGRRPAWAAS